MKPYKILYWKTIDFKSKPEELCLISSKDNIYDVYYRVQFFESPERIELYEVDKNGESILIDRLTCVN